MRVIFMGTPEYAVPTLEIIAKSESHEVIAVVTAPDKGKGRGKKISPSPVKIAAEKLSLPVLQPQSLNHEDFYSIVRELHPDIFVVVAFRILSDEVLSIPLSGAINAHASILPAFRGAAPIQWALINGEKETGVTVMQIDSGVDTGNILIQEKETIEPDDNVGTLSKKLSYLSAKMILSALEQIANEDITSIVQDHSKSSKAPKIKTEHLVIDWNMSAEQIVNRIRGLAPVNAPYSTFKNKKFKFYKASVKIDEKTLYAPGTIIETDSKKTLLVATGNGVAEIEMIQREGKQVLSAEDFLRGASFNAGDRFI